MSKKALTQEDEYEQGSRLIAERQQRMEQAVREGRRSARSLFMFPPGFARAAKVTFPKRKPDPKSHW